MAPPSRLMITHMVLENFKSYAGEQEIGPFHKRFSSVVGPNGSGKSNVIDALLFVFGKRAKQLRLSKVSELIHKSSRFPDLQYARVSVHFQLIYDDEDCNDGFEVVPNSSFIVTRTAYKDNTSNYNVDGKTSNFSAVGKILRTHGIDLDNNRFLILQGEVEQIAMMKPKGATKHEDGLLEYLEDIIGSNCFVERIEEMSKTLEDMNDQRTEKVNRLKMAEKDRDNLSDSKTEAEAFMNKEKEIRRKKNILYQIYEKIAADNVAELSSRCDEAKAKLAAEQIKMSESTLALKQKEETYKIKTSEYNRIAKEHEEYTNEFGAFERRDVKLHEDMKHNKAVVKKLQVTIEKEMAKKLAFQSEADDAVSIIETLQKSLGDIEEKKSVEESSSAEIMAGLQEATMELRCQLEEAQVKLGDAERGIANFQTEKEAIATSLSLAKSRSTNAISALKKLNVKHEQLVTERDTMSSRITIADEERVVAAAEMETLRMDLSDTEKDEIRLQGAVRAAVAAAEETKASMASDGRSSNVLNSIMKAARKGGPLDGVGVEGRLGDLGSISSKYDVAISTACGFLEYIVTNTTEDAQACMQFLRTNNMGRASFITLDKMSDWACRMKKKVEVPSRAVRLFDVINANDDKFLPAFYFALKDTLVVDDLDTATSIAYDGDRAKWRVVTSVGGLIDTSGAMSGGGNNTRKGLMMLEGSMKAASATSKKDAPTVTVADIQKMEGRISQLQKELKTCRSTKEDLESKLKSTGKSMKNLANEVSKLHMALASFTEKESILVDRIKILESEVSFSPEEEKQIELEESKLAHIEEQIMKASPNISTYRSAVSSLQRKIMDVGGPKLARAQQKLEILTKQFDDVSNKLANSEVAATTSRSNATKSANLCEKTQTEIDKTKQRLEDLLREQKELEVEAQQLIEAVEKTKESMIQQEEELNVITEEFESLKVEHGSMKTKELDIKNDIDLSTKKLDQQTHMLSSWRSELDDLRKMHCEEQLQFNQAAAEYLTPAKADITEVNNTTDDNIVGEGEDAANVNANIESLTILSHDALFAMQPNCEEIKNEISELEDEKAAMEANVNMGALLEYMKKDAFYRGRLVELEAITEARNAIRGEFEDLRRQRLEKFMSGFAIITMKLKEMYQMITLGGDAELELVDSLDPFSEGIVFSVRPPKKSWKNISNLSGGEKTLSSLALVFALHHFKPTALYVMDEIDAALDFKNVSIVANYIKERTKNAQFVIISLRNNMFELADRLVGIYKTNDATKSVTINPRSFQESTSGTLKNVPTRKAPAGVLVDTTNTN